MRKSTMDFLCGLCFLLISLLFTAQMGDLEGVSLVFPQALLVVVALGGLWFVAKGLYTRRQETSACDDEPVAWRKVGTIALFSLIYALLIMALGFFSSTFLFIVCASLVLGDKSHGMGRLAKISVLYSVIFCAILWVSFVKLLNVPTPTGLLF
ncbi:MAG: tripartite tricarboxylate transporter TctB family protein [Desulfovibrio sp.]|nr:tripartite tricarboxylate transporter TctB family protein [Desulfovibrio sp.]